MFKRLIIIFSGAGFASYCIIIAFLTFFGKNPATLHLTKNFQIGYAAVNAVLTPFGISGVIGGFSRKKALIRAFVTFQWWLATFVVIGLNVFNIILAKKDKGDFIRRCQSDLAKGQPESDFLAQCTALADNSEKAAFLAACIQGGIMLFLGIVLLIVGMREYSSISSKEETKNLLKKADFNETNDKIENLEDRLSPKTSNASINGGGTMDTFVPYDSGRYPPTNMTNVIRQPSNSIRANVDLTRRPTNGNTINPVQNSGLRRHPTDLRNQTFIPQSYQGLTRNPTVPGNVPSNMLARYPTNGSANVLRKPTIGNAYAPNSPRNYVGAPGSPQTVYPMAPMAPMTPMTPQRSFSTKQYVDPISPSYVTQFVIPPPQPSLINRQIIAPIEVNGNNDYNKDYEDYKDYSDYSDYSDYNDGDYNDDYVRKPYNSQTKTMSPYLTRMGMK